MEIKPTQRGFMHGEFLDAYKAKCSIQKSSAAMYDAIWLGIDDPDPKIMVSDAIKMGIPGAAERTGEDRNGWMEYPIPDEVLISTRMHLTQEIVANLLPLLSKFVRTGELSTDAILEDQHTEDGILENVVYDMEWLDVNKMDEAIAFLKSKYNITRK